MAQTSTRCVECGAPDMDIDHAAGCSATLPMPCDFCGNDFPMFKGVFRINVQGTVNVWYAELPGTIQACPDCAARKF